MRTPGPIERFMTDEHARIDGLLAASEGRGGAIDRAAFESFRHDLLRHIGMEEKVLLPFARERLGEPLSIAGALRRDHGQIAKLLVPSPSADGIARLREVLEAHNRIEEGDGLLYAICDDLAGRDAESIVERLRAQPNVPLAPHYDGPPHRT